MSASGSLDGTVTLTTSKDSYGNDLLYAVSAWNGRHLAHHKEFRNIPALLDSFERYRSRCQDVWEWNYGKSGTNWLYEIIWMLLSGSTEPAPTFMSKFMIEFYEDVDGIPEINSRRFYSTHIHPAFLPEDIFTGKVVVIIRNPLSVALSLYHLYATSVLSTLPYTGTPREFMLSFLYGSLPINRSGDAREEGLYKSWFDFNKAMWQKHKSHPDNVYVMFYEELKQNPVAHIQALGQFLGTEYPIETYQKIADLTQLETMKENSKRKINNAALSAMVSTFYRKGLIDEWKEHMSDDDFTEFFLYFHDQLKDYPDLRDRIRFE